MKKTKNLSEIVSGKEWYNLNEVAEALDLKSINIKTLELARVCRCDEGCCIDEMGLWILIATAGRLEEVMTEYLDFLIDCAKELRDIRLETEVIKEENERIWLEVEQLYADVGGALDRSESTL